MADLRSTLRQAIATETAARSRLKGARAAVDRLMDQMVLARRKLAEAEAQRGDVKADEVEQLVAGGAAVALQRVNDRVSEADATREIDAVRAALALCREEVRDAETNYEFSERRVADAICAVLATAAPRLIDDAASTKKGFEGQLAVLRFMRNGLSDGLRRRVDQVTSYPTNFSEGDHPELQRWEATAQALRSDPDAALPQ